VNTINTKDGTQIYYKDGVLDNLWCSATAGRSMPIAWESQMVHLASNGFRCIAHDRRGHGRSSQPWNGNDMDTYADDLRSSSKRLT